MMSKINVNLMMVFFCIFLVSCADENRNKQVKKKDTTSKVSVTENSSQMKQVVAIHDELMTKMGMLGNLSNRLKKTDSSRYKEEIKQLEYSHDAMMEWMKDFGAKFTSDEIMKGKELSQEKQVMLDIEEEEVRELQIIMNSSIKDAQAKLDAATSNKSN